ncbi:MAG: GNAT family N-acetyltransferase [Candidatus Paceibacterota bacterium]
MNPLRPRSLDDLFVFATTPHGEFAVHLVTAPDQSLVWDTAVPFVQKMVREITEFTVESFGGELDEASADGIRAHIQNIDAFAIASSRGQIQGFAAGKFLDKSFFHLHGVAVRHSTKNKGVAKLLVQHLWGNSNLPQMCFTTQSPVMFCLGRSLVTEIFPNTTTGIPSSLQKDAKKLLGGRDEGFCPESGVVSNLYGRCLYPQIPLSNNPDVNTWFAEALGIQDSKTRNGFLFIGSR